MTTEKTDRMRVRFHRRAAAVSRLRRGDTPLQDDDLAQAPGWHESSFDLQRGLLVREVCGSDLAGALASAATRSPTRVDVLL